MLFSKSKDTIMIVFMFIGKLFYSYISWSYKYVNCIGNKLVLLTADNPFMAIDYLSAYRTWPLIGQSSLI